VAPFIEVLAFFGGSAIFRWARLASFGWFCMRHRSHETVGRMYCPDLLYMIFEAITCIAKTCPRGESSTKTRNET
jgi:hypothetical protein